MTMSDKDSPGLLVPPPIVYFVCLMIGLGLDTLWPLPFLARTLQFVLGFTIIAVSFLFFGLVLRAFSKSKTSIDHRKPTTEIITTGPFAYSRNPVYLSMTMLFIGVAVTVDRLWFLVMAVPAAVLIHYVVILREEAFLKRAFGDEYRRYKAAVRRRI